MDYTSSEKRKIVKDDYNAIADLYAKRYGSIDYCKSYIDKFVADLIGRDVLDVGCGAGQITNYLTQKGFDVVGLDFSQKILRIAKQNYPNCKFIQTDICEFKRESQVDGIITKDVLFHLPDEDLIRVLHIFKKLLKPKGSLCIIMDVLREPGEKIFIEELDGKHQIYYNCLSPEKLKALLEDAGFSIASIQLVEANENVSAYAKSIMIFQVRNKM